MDYIKAFEEYLESQEKSINTIECYIRDVQQLGTWSSKWLGLQVQELAQINLTHFSKFLRSQYDSYITINRKIASINSYYSFMFEAKFIQQQMAIKPIKFRTQPTFKGLEEKELWKFRTEIHRVGNRMHICLFEILLNTGIRVSELVNIKLQDIEISQRKGKLTVLGKGEVLRFIPLNKDSRKAINDYLKVRRNVGNNLFIGQRGQLGRNAVNLILKKYGQRVGVKISAHMLRHTLGYGLVKNGTKITTIQQILGHSNIQTSNRYIMTMEKDVEAALEEVEW